MLRANYERDKQAQSRICSTVVKTMPKGKVKEDSQLESRDSWGEWGDTLSESSNLGGDSFATVLLNFVEPELHLVLSRELDHCAQCIVAAVVAQDTHKIFDVHKKRKRFPYEIP